MSDVQVPAAPGDPLATAEGYDEPRSRPAWRADAVLLLVVGLGAVLRFWGIGDQSFWFDEWLTTEAVAGGPADLARHVATREGIAPPYFIVMWVWSRVVGDGEVALRSFSALAGVATVPVAYAVAVRLGQRRRVARGAALLVAANPLLVWYSQEARPYALLALLGALSVLAAVEVDRTGRRADVVRWGIVAAAAVAVHYFALFVVAGEAAGLAARRRVPPRVLALGAVPVALVLAALAPFALEQHSHATNRAWIAQFALTERLEDAVHTAFAGPGARFAWLWLVPLAVTVAIGAVTLSRSGRRDRRVVGALLLLVVAGVVPALGAAAVGTDVLLGRYLLAAFVPLLVASAVALLAGRSFRLGAAAVLVIAGVWTLAGVAVVRDPRLHRADWRAVADVVVDDPSAHARVLLVDTNGGQSSPLHRYLPSATVLAPGEVVTIDRIDVLVARPAGVPCNFYVGRGCGFVFLGGPLPEPLADRFTLSERRELDQFVVERYRADGPVTLERDDLLAVPGDGAYVWVTPAGR